jgi:hypothetical protein
MYQINTDRGVKIRVYYIATTISYLAFIVRTLFEYHLVMLLKILS